MAATSATDGNLSVTETSSKAGSATQTEGKAAVCTAAHLLSRKQGLSGSSVVYHNFGGAGVTF